MCYLPDKPREYLGKINQWRSVAPVAGSGEEGSYNVGQADPNVGKKMRYHVDGMECDHIHDISPRQISV